MEKLKYLLNRYNMINTIICMYGRYSDTLGNCDKLYVKLYGDVEILKDLVNRYNMINTICVWHFNILIIP